jgi:hypothetical protein
MADRKITQLVEVVSPNVTDILPVVNTSITKKVTLDNLVKASTFSTNKINSLAEVTAPGETDQLVVQPTDGSAPLKVRLENIYPIVVDSSTIDLTFNPTNRNFQASIIPGSINGIHLGTGVIQTSAIQDGAVTEAKIDPNAKIRGATGGGTDRVFYENDQVVTTAYTITSGKNAMTAGPVTINDGITVTVPDGSTWTVV